MFVVLLVFLFSLFRECVSLDKCGGNHQGARSQKASNMGVKLLAKGTMVPVTCLHAVLFPAGCGM